MYNVMSVLPGKYYNTDKDRPILLGKNMFFFIFIFKFNKFNH